MVMMQKNLWFPPAKLRNVFYSAKFFFYMNVIGIA